MISPTIHLNGTSKDRLLNALCNASDKLNEAYNALKQTAPNGRDYYVQGPDAITQATDEHMDRLRRLDAIKAEIDQLAESIAIQ